MTGDLIHVDAVKSDDPSVTISFDSDPIAATAACTKGLCAAEHDGALIAAAHHESATAIDAGLATDACL